ncbi:hypothetical protein [Rheinheimera fenheensis]|uniref:hypothetical protein n=1 Tax=Rheinheimera fenheensis TaxID=3152295 RepID=UPI0032618B4A
MESTVNELINISVYKTGCRYLAAAQDLMTLEKEHFLPAFVLASFASEIFLKSLIVKRKKVTGTIDIPGIGVSECYTYKNEFRKFTGHTLSDTFKQINPPGRARLLSELDSNEADFLHRLSYYDNYFNGLRYFYEERAIQKSDSGIIELAQLLEAACRRIGLENE